MQKSSSNHRPLRLAFSSDVRSLDPRIGVDSPSIHIVRMLFEGLLQKDPQGNIQSAMAEKYLISNDYKTYTFYMRSAFWSNGDEVTAYDFEYTWKKMVDPKTGSLGVQSFYPIKNVRAVIEGEKTLDDLGIKALDKKTFIVELEHPTPYFLELVTLPNFCPVNRKVDQKNPNWFRQTGSQFVGNGPFLLHSHLLENELVVKKNPTYWDAEHVQLPSIHIAIVPSDETILQLFEKKQIDWIGKPLGKIPQEALTAFRKQNRLEIGPSLGLQWCCMNTGAFPFHNKKMRQAFAYAIDRNLIAENILEGGELPATGVLPYTLATQDTPIFGDYNPEKAVTLFNQALQELGLSKQQLPDIILNYAGHSKNVVEEMQQQWLAVLGIFIQLEKQEWKTFYTKLQKGNFQMGVMGWQSWLRDPIYIMQTFRSKSDGLNMSRWENKDYKDYLTIAEQETDLAKRRYYFNKAEQLLIEEMPVIPLFFNTVYYAKSSQLKNVSVSDLDEIDFHFAYFE